MAFTPQPVTPVDLGKMCASIQKSLLGQNLPENLVANRLARARVIDALKSPRNEGALKVVGAGPNGGNPMTMQDYVKQYWGNTKIYTPGSDCKLEVMVNKPYCTEKTNKGPLDVCNPASYKPVDNRVKTEIMFEKMCHKTFELSPDAVECLCRDYNFVMQQELNHIAESIMDEILCDLYKCMYQEMGAYANGDSSVTATRCLNVVNTQNGQLIANPSEWYNIDEEYSRQNVSSSPFALGGYRLNQYMNVFKNGGFGQSAIGANPTAQFGNTDYFVDTYMDKCLSQITQTNDCHLMTWAPGAFQLLWHYDNVGINQIFDQDPRIKRFVLTVGQGMVENSVFNGQQFDAAIFIDGCNRKAFITLSKRYALWCLPAELGQTCGDKYNHKNLFKLCCGPVECPKDC